MDIDGPTLIGQAERALQAWPFISGIETRYNLPQHCLLAVGSRETNLNSYYIDHPGDQGHGNGMWQLDDRSHTIPRPFPVDAQADIAAAMLADLFRRYGVWQQAFAAYNSGQGEDKWTTGGNYGADVFARMRYLQQHLNVPLTPPHDTTFEEWLMANDDVADQIIKRLDQVIALLDQSEDKNGSRITWRLGRVLNMLQRQIELKNFARPPDYVNWQQRESEWQKGRSKS